MRHETFQHVRLPDAVWCAPETRTALRDRRVGHLFLLAKKYAGASQARIAAATGLNQSEVSRIQRGDRLVTAIDVLERVADGFAMPDPARMLLGLAPTAWQDTAAPEPLADPAAAGAPAGTGTATAGAPAGTGTATAEAPAGTGGAAPHARLVTPAQLPPAIRGFVGRSVELAWLHGHAEAGTLLVVGPAGIGKTALALTWAHAAAAGFPDGQLYVDLNASSDDPVDPATALAGFIRALDTADTTVPPTLAERTARYRSLLAGKRLLIIVDDVSAAEQVRPLLPGNQDCLVLLTSRWQLDDLLVHEGATALPLGPLPRDEARDLVARIVGRSRVDAAPHAADDLAEACGRVPLALRTAAVRLARSPAMALNAADPPPPARSPAGAIVPARHTAPGSVVAVVSPRPVRSPGVPRVARRTLGWSAAAAVGVLAALALAVLAGGPALAQIVDRTSRHAALASRGGQLALLRLLVLVGCGSLLVAIARTARQWPILIAGCLAGVECATLLATPGVTAHSLSGPPSLVALVQLVAASVWVGTVTVMATTVLPAVHRQASADPGVRRAALALTVLVSAAGTWLAARHLGGAPATSAVVFRRLLTAESALLIAALGLASIRLVHAGRSTRSSFGTAGTPLDTASGSARHDARPAVRALVLAVVVLLAVSGSVAAIPTHTSGRSTSQPAPSGGRPG